MSSLKLSATTSVEVEISTIIRRMTEDMVGDYRLVNGVLKRYSNRFDVYEDASASETAQEKMKQRILAIEAISLYYGVPCYLIEQKTQ